MLTEGAKSSHEYFFYAHWGTLGAVRSGDWKLRIVKGKEALYNLAPSARPLTRSADPGKAQDSDEHSKGNVNVTPEDKQKRAKRRALFRAVAITFAVLFALFVGWCCTMATAIISDPIGAAFLGGGTSVAGWKLLAGFLAGSLISGGCAIWIIHTVLPRVEDS